MKKFLKKHRTLDKLRDEFGTQELLSKVLQAFRLLGLLSGDVLFYGESHYLKLIVFMATLLKKGRKVYITNSLKEAKHLLLLNDIHTVFLEANYDPEGHDTIAGYDIRREQVMAIYWMYECGDVNATLLDKRLEEDYDTLQRFPAYEGEYQKALDILTDRDSYSTCTSCLQFSINGKEYDYSYKNIMSMLDAIDSEFNKLEQHHVDLQYVTFEQGFAYMLYFTLRGDRVVFNDRYNVAKRGVDKKLKPKKVIVSEETFIDQYHTDLKYQVFSKLNRFLTQFILTKWLVVPMINFALRDYYQLASRKDELVILTQGDPRYMLEKLYRRIRTKVSVVFGTYADGHTIGIDRFDVKSDDYQYTMMGELKIGVDSLGRLNVGGDRIHRTLKNVYPLFNKNKDVKYHLTHIYGNVENHIITVYGHQKDIYFNGEEPTMFTPALGAINILPFVKDCAIVKHNQDQYQDQPFVILVDLDETFIERSFEDRASTYTSIQQHLDITRRAVNEKFSESGQIHSIVISKKFFRIMRSFKEYTTVEGFVRMLDQQPFNLDGDL